MKKILSFIIILVLLFVIRNNISSIVNGLKNQNTAENIAEKLASEEKKNKFLQERLFYVKTNQFVEEEAREKLGMLRPGEYIVIAPPTPLNRERIEIDTKPNWEKWFELFF